ncbi:MAG: thiamine pyrophosphate-binding protein [Candidatus Dormiibacterota bacterium]
MRSGSELMAEAIWRGAGRTIFALPGSHIGGVLDACRRLDMAVVNVRHEENAVLMAEGWSLATGQPGLAMVTAGPGLTNALAGMAEANAAGAPVVVIAGRTAISKRDWGAVQDVDQLRLAAPLSKWSRQCLEPARIPEYVAEAVRQARLGSPGVAYLEVPEDVLTGHARLVGEAGPPQVGRPVPHPAELQELRRLLQAAERPLLVAGSGAFFSGAGPALRNFVERTGIPLTTTSAARGLVDDEHPLCLGSLVHGGAALAWASLALVLGSRFNANLMYGRSPLFGEDQVVAQVDIQPEHLGGLRPPQLALVGDVAATLELLTEAWTDPPQRWAEWQGQAQSAANASRQLWEAEANEPASPLHPGWLAMEAAALFEQQPGIGTWVSDGGDSVPWGIAFSKAHTAGSNMLIGSALGTLGVGLPFAIAAGLAHPGGPLLLFSGDGAFGFSAMELQTAATQRVGLVVVVVNNGVWRGPGTSPDQVGNKVDHAGLAVSLGCWGRTASTQAEFSSVLGHAFEVARDGVPCVVDAHADGKVVSKLLRSLDELGLM